MHPGEYFLDDEAGDIRATAPYRSAATTTSSRSTPRSNSTAPKPTAFASTSRPARPSASSRARRRRSLSSSSAAPAASSATGGGSTARSTTTPFVPPPYEGRAGGNLQTLMQIQRRRHESQHPAAHLRRPLRPDDRRPRAARRHRIDRRGGARLQHLRRRGDVRRRQG